MKQLVSFLAQYYERVIAVIVMLVFAIFSILLLFKVSELETQIQQDIPPRATDVKAVDLKDLQDSYERLQQPPTWKDTAHALFVGPKMKELQPGILSMYNGGSDLKTTEGFTYVWLHAHNLPTKRPIANLDPDDDKFTIWEEYLADTDPMDPKSHPDFALKLRIDGDILKKSFPFKFSGSMEDGAERKFGIQRAEQGGETHWLRMNDVIPDKQYPGYKIVQYIPIITNRIDKTISPPLTIPTDVSQVYLQRTGEPRILLIKGQARTTDELYVKFYYIIGNNNLEAMSKNEKFQLDKDCTYEIEDIIPSKNPDEVRVQIRRVETGKEFLIKPITQEERSRYQTKDYQPPAQDAK